MKHKVTGASLKTKIRWFLSKMKREAYYLFQSLRGFKKYETEVDLDKVLIGEQCQIPVEKWVPKTQEWGRVSCLLRDSPYVVFLDDIVKDESLLSNDSFLENHAYYKMGQVSIQFDGSYFGAKSPEELKEHMRGFYQAYKNMCAGKTLTTSSEDYRHSQPGEPVVMKKVSESDCYEIKDGHHRSAMYFKAGKQKMNALIVGEKSTYLQKLLYSCLQTKNTELYQPVDKPEVKDWAILRQCDDRFQMMLQFLNQEGLMNEIKTVLDMPCSYGWFVRAFKEKGFEAVGVDRDPYSLKIGEIVYGLSPKVLRQGEILEVLSRTDQRYDMVLFLSVIHHFAFHGEAGTESEILKKIDEITAKVLILDSGQNHEDWFRTKLSHWDDDYIKAQILKHTSFQKVIILGKDTDNRGKYANQYARTLFACVK